MNKLVLALAFLIASTVFAEEKTLLSGEIENGGFGAPVVKFSPVRNQFAVWVGGQGGWLINHSFMLGGGGYGLATTIAPTQIARASLGITRPLAIQCGYGGLVMEVIGSSDNLVHYTVSTLIGAGAVRYGERPFSDQSYDYIDEPEPDVFFVVEPGVNLELNVTTFFRLNVGASYRSVSGVHLVGLSNSDLSGVSVNVGLKFGKF